MELLHAPLGKMQNHLEKETMFKYSVNPEKAALVEFLDKDTIIHSTMPRHNSVLCGLIRIHGLGYLTGSCTCVYAIVK